MAPGSTAAGALDRADRQQLAAVAGRVARAAARRRGRPRGDSGRLGVGVEAEHRVGLGQLLGELLAVPLGQAADGDDLRAGVGGAPSSVSIESFLALSTKPQVLTTTTSAPPASSTSSQPAASSRPASSSESTSLRAQPSVTRATRREAGTREVYWRGEPLGPRSAG